MSVPSKAVMQGIRKLIREITGFGEDEENFYICEQYCLSHVMHHTYPSVNRNEVKKLLDGYVHRFYVHGYFKVSDGLDAEVKSFLSNEFLFKKNPQADIQWVLLSLLTNLASNLTQVVKLPKIMPVNEEEKSVEEMNWGEYLREGLPSFEYEDPDVFSDNSDDFSFNSQSSDTLICYTEDSKIYDNVKDREKKKALVIKDSPYQENCNLSRQHIIDDLVKRREEETSYIRDIVLRGNFVEKLGFFMNRPVPFGTQQILSEFEMVGYILKQFLTGENVLKRKGITNPSTCSLTNVAIKSYLASVEPYMNMIRVFKEFNAEITFFEIKANEKFLYSKNRDINSYGLINVEESAKYSNMYNNVNKMTLPEKKTVPNVIKLYNLALMEALGSFESKILTMSEYQHSYTLLKVLSEIRPSFSDLSSLFAVHLSATANWLNEPNWLCAIRIITTLYKAVVNSTCNRMGFLYMSIFFHCLQSYLDITDRWISSLTLNDPHDEYIIYRSEEEDISGTNPYKTRIYKEKLPAMGVRETKILDYLTDKLIHVGHSIDVLHRLDRSLIKDQNESNIGIARDYLYRELLKNIEEEFKMLQGNKLVSSSGYKELSSISIESKSNVSEINGIENAGSTNNNSTTSMICNKDVHDSCDLNMMKDITFSEFCWELCEHDESGAVQKSIWPLDIIIESNLKKILNTRVLRTCNLAKDILVNEFQLKVHLDLLRNVFLFNEPHLIQPFIYMMFHEKMIWRNNYALTFYLRECIESRYSEQAKYLSISMDWNQTNQSDSILDAIDAMTINYQIGWPLLLVFTPHIMSLYNNVFRHLFKLHLAHLALCKLQYRDTKKEKSDIVKSSRQRLQLLRFWCMSSLGRLRSYFMAQISTPFDLQISCYQHLTDILEAHELFVKKIHSRCLLDDETEEGQGLIFNIFVPLCYDIYQFGTTYEIVPDGILTPTENIFFNFQKKFLRLMAELEKE